MSYCDVYVCSFQYFVILYVFSYLVPCCGGRYDFRIKWLICSSLPLSFVWGIIFYLFCFAFSGIQHVLTERVTGTGTGYPSRAHGFTTGCLVGSLFLIFLVFCCVFFNFVCLRLVSCIMPCPHVANVSGFSIFDCPFGFI